MMKVRLLVAALGIACAFSVQARDLATVQKSGVIKAATEGQIQAFQLFRRQEAHRLRNRRDGSHRQENEPEGRVETVGV